MRGDITHLKSTMDVENAKYKNIHRWLKIANITPHLPDVGSVEPKRYSVDLNKSLLPLGSLLSIFLHIVGLQSFCIIYIYICESVYMRVYVCLRGSERASEQAREKERENKY